MSQSDTESDRCSCGAPEPCLAPRYGGRHVPPEIWLAWEANRERAREYADENPPARIVEL